MVADYEPQDQQRCIRCSKNDIIFVQKPFLFHFMVSYLDSFHPNTTAIAKQTARLLCLVFNALFQL